MIAGFVAPFAPSLGAGSGVIAGSGVGGAGRRNGSAATLLDCRRRRSGSRGFFRLHWSRPRSRWLHIPASRWRPYPALCAVGAIPRSPPVMLKADVLKEEI